MLIEVEVRKSWLYGYDNFELIMYNDSGDQTEVNFHGENTLNELLKGFKELGVIIIDER